MTISGPTGPINYSEQEFLNLIRNVQTDAMQNGLMKQAELEAKKMVSFGVSHLVLILALAVSIIGGSYLWVSRRADLADAKVEFSKTQAQSSDKANATFQQQTAQQIAVLMQQNASLQSDVAALANAITTRDSALGKQTAVVPTLTRPEVSFQWGGAAAEPPPAIDAQGNFITPLPLAQKSLIALLAVPVLQADKSDAQNQVGKLQANIANDATAFNAEVKAHASDVAACTLDKQALKDENTKTRADARKSKFKWFGAGYVAGLLTKPFAVAMGY